MTRVHRAAAACAAVAAASVLLAYANSSTGDYPSDAGPAIRALLDGHVGQALATPAADGVVVGLVRLPFAALASLTGGGELAVYRLGCIPCLLALGLRRVRARPRDAPCAARAGARVRPRP